MTTQDYINWHLSTEEMGAYSSYFLAKQEIINSLSFEKYKSIVLNRFENNQKEADQYLRLASQFTSNSNFQAAFNQMVEKMRMPDKSNSQVRFIQDVQNALKTNADEYQRLIQQISDALISITSVLGVLDTDSLLPSKETDEALAKIYGSRNQPYDKILLQNDLKQSGAFFGQYKYLLSMIPDFQELANKTVADDASIPILSKILTPIQTLMGIAAEYQSEIELNALLDDFCKDFNTSKGSIVIKRVGDESDKNTGKGFRVGTADLSISMEQGKSNISFNAPDLGVSLKQSRLRKKTDSYHVQLKGTTYGALFQEIDPQIVTAFYNLFANTAPTVAGIPQKPVPSKTLTSAYKYMRSASLVTALIGSANAQSLVAIFVINNKPYTIYDLLEGLTKQSDLSKVIEMKPAFLSRHRPVMETHKELFNKYTADEKEKRSSSIRSEIDDTSVKYAINLQASMLKTIAPRI